MVAPIFRCVEHRKWLAYDLAICVLLDLPGSRIPGSYLAGCIQHKDCAVFYPFHQSLQPFLAMFLRVADLGHILDATENSCCRAIFVQQQNAPHPSHKKRAVASLPPCIIDNLSVAQDGLEFALGSSGSPGPRRCRSSKRSGLPLRYTCIREFAPHPHSTTGSFLPDRD